MSRLTREDWMVYSILRSLQGKERAEKYRHERNAKNAKYGIGLPRKDSEWTLVRDYGMDGVLVKQFIPGTMDAEERARFEESNWIEIPFSSYDCTGKPFSHWMSFFDVPGGVWVYHSIGMDV